MGRVYGLWRRLCLGGEHFTNLIRVGSSGCWEVFSLLYESLEIFAKNKEEQRSKWETQETFLGHKFSFTSKEVEKMRKTVGGTYRYFALLL